MAGLSNCQVFKRHTVEANKVFANAVVEERVSTFPDLRAQLLSRFYINLRGLPAAALENSRRAFRKRLLLSVGHIRMNPEPTRQLGNRAAHPSAPQAPPSP